ncbi:uncharacterized protein EV154DRAFT_476064 [Mucor mucedo]|uniref:uncharacterized protein n=1 Tax=Mucor mucedo TaxID=29922 RepID=UPI00221E3BDA|nr:uncharacterized protein EV154DRAFT_476064 [Mucor mucedo]KAI7896842.1 hypothetical protein EV154DRAFT_476064 [Mucor mucedo]
MVLPSSDSTDMASIFNSIVRSAYEFEEYCLEQEQSYVVNIVRILLENIGATINYCILEILNILFWAAYTLKALCHDIIMMVPHTVRNPLSAPYTTSSNPKAITTNILSPASSNSVLNSGNTICSILDNNKCVQELKSIPTNCYLYQILPTAIRGGSNEVMGKINYIMARVVIPTTGFIYPITHVQPKFNPIASMIDTILEKLSPTTKMMICSVEPQPMTKAQMMMDLLKRVAQFKKPTVSYTLNATVQCVYSKEGRQNLVSIIYTAEPTQNEPIQEELVQTQPAVETLAQAQPAQAQPAQEVQSTQGETAQVQPTQEPVQAQPTQVQPATQPAQVQPAQAESAHRELKQVIFQQPQSSAGEPSHIRITQGTQTQFTQPRSTQNQSTGSPVIRDQAIRDRITGIKFNRTQTTRNQAAIERFSRDRATRDQTTRNQPTRSQTTRDQATVDEPTRDQTTRDQTTRDGTTMDQGNIDGVTRDQTARTQATRSQATRDEAARDQATRDQAIRDQAIRDQAIRDQAIREQAIRDQATRDKATREQATRDQAARDQAARDQAARDKATREQATRDQAARDRAIRDQAARDQAARERILRDQTAREQISRGQTTRDQTTRDQTTRGQTTRDQVTRDRSTRDQTTRNQPLGDQATNRDRTTQRQPTRSKPVLHPVFPVTQEQYDAALEFEKEADYSRSDPVVFRDTEEDLLTEPDKYGKAEKLLRNALKEAEKIIDTNLDTRFPTEQVLDERYETISLEELYRKKQLAEEAASVWKEPPPFVPLDVDRYEIPEIKRARIAVMNISVVIPEFLKDGF